MDDQVNKGLRSYTSHIVCVVAFVCIILGYVTGYWIGEDQTLARSVVHESYRFAADNAVGVEAGSEPPIEDDRSPCVNSRGQNESDLCAQWRAATAAEKSAKWTARGFWAAIGAAALSFASVIFVVLALAQARRANAIAEDTAKRQLRAYLAVSEVLLEPMDDPQILRGVLVYENYGDTPAEQIHTSLRAEFRHVSDATVPIEPPPRHPGGSDGRLAKGREERNYDTVGVIVEGVHTPGPPADQMLEAIAVGGGVIFIHGWITYRDIFDVCHCVNFKWIYDRDAHQRGRGPVIGHGGNDAKQCGLCQTETQHLHSPVAPP